MSQSKEQPLSEEELDWIQLRRELEDIRGKSDTKKSVFSRETWFIPAGESLKDAHRSKPSLQSLIQALRLRC